MKWCVFSVHLIAATKKSYHHKPEMIWHRKWPHVSPETFIRNTGKHHDIVPYPNSAFDL